MNQYLEYFKKYPNKILNTIVSAKLIEPKIAREYYDVFEKYSMMSVICNKNIFEYDFFEKEEFDFYGMDNYFMVKLNSYREYESNFVDYVNLKNDIIKNFNICYITRYETTFHIHKSQFELFISRYENNKHINWDTLSLNKCLHFSDDIIIKYDHILNWNILQYSGNLNWTFELIESKKDILNWMIISSYEFLKWDKETIDKYKEYLIFSLGEGWRKKSFSLTQNKKGQSFQIKPNELQGNLFDFKLKGSISLCETITWSIEIIDKFYDYWDWEELCLNKGVKWDENLIDKYISKVNFKALSSNPSVKWSIELIQKYINNWDWAELSYNYGIHFNFEMILQFEELWHWKPKLNNWYWDEYDKDKDKKCLASNKRIIWNLNIVEYFYEKIDFWRISLHGIVEENVIIKYSSEFDRKEHCGWKFHKSSDFRVTENLYKTAWENLKENDQTIFSNNIIDFFIYYKTTIRYSTGNLASDANIIERNISLLELFKENKYKDLTIDLVMLNDNKWGDVLFNNEFVNKHLIEESIKPILSKDFSIKLLEELKMNVNS